MKRIALLTLALLLTATLGAAPVSAGSSAVYVVRPGDTLAAIAARHGVGVCDLASANNLSWYSWVYTGQRLFIPGRQAEGSVIHVVFRGDTLWRIAQTYNTTVRAIMEANNLKSTLIFPGQRLVIPAPEQTVDGWVGTVVNLPAGNQFGSYFLRSDGQRYDIGSTDEAINDMLAEARNSGAQIKVWGTIEYGVPAVEARHISVTRLEFVSPSDEEGDVVDGWVGTVVKLPAGNQFGSYFLRNDGQRYDIGTTDDAVRDQLAEVRWSGAQIKVWGRVYYGVPATEARHIEVDQLEVVGSATEARNLSPLATAKASSNLPSDRWGTYGVYSAVDGQLATSWAEGVAEPGVGEWVELTFPEAVKVEWLGLDVGYDRDAGIFAKNNRIKRAAITFSDGRGFEATFSDSRGVQKVSIPEALGGSVQTSKIRVTIEDVYPGSRYDDTCLAELEVWGKTN